MRHLVSGLSLILFGVLVFACSSKPLDPNVSQPDFGSEDDGTSGSANSDTDVPTPGATSRPTFVQPEYPPGPYGTKPHSTIANLSFVGWRAPAASGYDPANFETISLSDYYNPDGRRDVKLIFVNASAVWCGVCRSEFRHVKDTNLYATYRAKGVEFIAALFEDNDSYPARPRDLVNWGKPESFDVKFPLVLDPGFKLGVYFTSDATPLNLLVDARTMKIVNVSMGYSENYWASVDAVLEQM